MAKVELKIKKRFSKVGAWSFLIGIAIAVLAGTVIKVGSSTVMVVLGLLGLLVGILNITAKEAVPFLVATIALVVSVSGMAVVLSAGGAWANQLVTILDNIAIFVAPAALIVALKSIYVLASD